MSAHVRQQAARVRERHCVTSKVSDSSKTNTTNNAHANKLHSQSSICRSDRTPSTSPSSLAVRRTTSSASLRQYKSDVPYQDNAVHMISDTTPVCYRYKFSEQRKSKATQTESTLGLSLFSCNKRQTYGSDEIRIQEPQVSQSKAYVDSKNHNRFLPPPDIITGSSLTRHTIAAIATERAARMASLSNVTSPVETGSSASLYSSSILPTIDFARLVSTTSSK
jgi:hypothetical protein